MTQIATDEANATPTTATVLPLCWKPGSLPDRLNDMLRDNPGDVDDIQAALHVLVAYWAAVNKGAMDRRQMATHLERLESAWNDHVFGVYEPNREGGELPS